MCLIWNLLPINIHIRVVLIINGIELEYTDTLKNWVIKYNYSNDGEKTLQNMYHLLFYIHNCVWNDIIDYKGNLLYFFICSLNIV